MSSWGPLYKGSPAGLVAGLAALAVLSIAACSPARPMSTDRPLIVDKSFDFKTADPHRELGGAAAIVAKALYGTLLTFAGRDESTPIPSVALSYSSSEDASRYTFKLRHDVVFSDGATLTSADVVFSFKRVINLKSRPSVLLDGVTVSAPDADTVVLTSSDPNPAIPFIVTNPALAIVNSREVRSHGGTDGPGADKTDKAEDFLNSMSAGSGPYILESFNALTEVKLAPNPRYRGARPFYRRVVLRSLDAPTQLADIVSGTDEIALDLSFAQAGTLIGRRSVHIRAVPGPDLVFLFANENPLVSPVTPNRHFQNAVRYAIDYSALVELMGAGSIQAAGVIPDNRLGALPAWTAPRRDLARARAELAASGIKNPSARLGYGSDLAVGGVPMSALASMIKAELAEAGIKVDLAGSPTPAATADYGAGGQQMGLWSLTAASPDPNSYLAFLPGRAIGLRAGWTGGADPALESLGIQAATAADEPTRAELFQLMQGALNEDGPFFPLLQPGRVIVATKGIAASNFNPTWSVDLAAVSG